jgi:hypothetical protein
MKTGLALAAAAAIAMLATACGSSAASSASPDPSGSFSYTQELALAQCMRAHGLPTFPNPSASGGFSSTVLTTFDTSTGQAAYGTCRHLLTGAPSISQLQAVLQEEQAREAKALPALVKFAQCMRSHGVPDFSLPGQGSAAPSGKTPGYNPDSPQFQAAVRTCQSVLPPGAHLSIHTGSSASSAS